MLKHRQVPMSLQGDIQQEKSQDSHPTNSGETYEATNEGKNVSRSLSPSPPATSRVHWTRSLEGQDLIRTKES